MLHVEKVRSQLGLSSNLGIVDDIAKGYEIVGLSLEGNLVEAASRLYQELADKSHLDNSPASVIVSNTMLVSVKQLGDVNASHPEHFLQMEP